MYLYMQRMFSKWSRESIHVSWLWGAKSFEWEENIFHENLFNNVWFVFSNHIEVLTFNWKNPTNTYYICIYIHNLKHLRNHANPFIFKGKQTKFQGGCDFVIIIYSVSGGAESRVLGGGSSSCIPLGRTGDAEKCSWEIILWGSLCMLP